ncbi:MAG: hypothetical protein ACRD0J_03690, partial [Acidimicrobiales bacterium]
ASQRPGPVLVTPRVREAYPSDVKKDETLDATERHIYAVLADHVTHGKNGKAEYTGIVCLKRETIMRESGYSESTVRRKIDGLIRKGRICLPEGDAGGRAKALKYHLHPDGKPCGFPEVPLTQRGTVQRRKTSAERVSTEERVSNFAEEKGCQPDAKRVSDCHERVSTGQTHIRTEPSLITISEEPSFGGGGSAGREVTSKGTTGEQKNKISADDRKALDRIAQRIGLERNLIDGRAAYQIKGYLEDAGFSLLQMACVANAETLAGATKSRIGLLITIAKEFKLRFGDVSFPSCLHCEDKLSEKLKCEFCGGMDDIWNDICAIFAKEHACPNCGLKMFLFDKADEFGYHEDWSDEKVKAARIDAVCQCAVCETCRGTNHYYSFEDCARLNKCPHCFGETQKLAGYDRDSDSCKFAELNCIGCNSVGTFEAAIQTLVCIAEKEGNWSLYEEARAFAKGYGVDLDAYRRGAAMGARA